PVSGFAAQARGRRRLDAAWTFATVLRALGGEVNDVGGEPFERYLRAQEAGFESAGAAAEELPRGRARAAERRAWRRRARAGDGPGGYLLLNPCSFIRRVALELPDVPAPLPLSGPLKACQVEGGAAKVVVEVPALGFAWVPRSAPGAAAPPAARMRLADE